MIEFSAVIAIILRESERRGNGIDRRQKLCKYIKSLVVVVQETR